MGWERWSRRAVGTVAGFVVVAHAAAQHEPATTPPHPPAATVPAPRRDAEQKRGAADAPTHAPQPALPPLFAFQHLLAGNAAAVAARATRQEPSKPKERPAGAGRYLAAVLVCADLDVDLPACFGVARSDLLILSTPGPFASPETAALLERTVADERLSLVLVLTHDSCKALAPRATPDALTPRAAATAAEANRRQQPLAKVQAMLQREQLLAASELLRSRCARDELRVLPGAVDAASWAFTSYAPHADTMPLAPVK